MKIRIQDNSIRLRLTIKEVEAFADSGSVIRSTQLVNGSGLGPSFAYRLENAPELAESEVVIEGASISVRLCPADRAALLKPEEEGVYIRREWTDPAGETHRFMAFVEKDRPGSACEKKEQWIYDAPRGGPIETRPIPPKKTCK
ncbi:MAG: hypothetical protein ABI579_05235 [Candidatus Sumerlaeota bacterium]